MWMLLLWNLLRPSYCERVKEVLLVGKEDEIRTNSKVSERINWSVSISSRKVNGKTEEHRRTLFLMEWGAPSRCCCGLFHQLLQLPVQVPASLFHLEFSFNWIDTWHFIRVCAICFRLCTGSFVFVGILSLVISFQVICCSLAAGWFLNSCNGDDVDCRLGGGVLLWPSVLL